MQRFLVHIALIVIMSNVTVSHLPLQLTSSQRPSIITQSSPFIDLGNATLSSPYAQSLIMPLPGGNGGPVPNGDNCTLRGMVYLNGNSVAAADLAITSNNGQLNAQTQVFSGTTTETRPFYEINLLNPVLSATLGSLITITADYGGFARTITQTIVACSQQSDIVLQRPTLLSLGFAGDIRGNQPPPESFFAPGAVAVGPSGFIYIADKLGARVQVFGPDRRFIRQFGSFGNLPGQFSYITGIAVDQKEFVYVVDNDLKRVQKFASDGTLILGWNSDAAGMDKNAFSPWGVAIDPIGNVLVTVNSQILKFTPGGKRIGLWGPTLSPTITLNSALGIHVDTQGFTYVADNKNDRIVKLDPTMNPVTIGISDSLAISQPWDIAVDAVGNMFIGSGGPEQPNHFGKITRVNASGNLVWSHVFTSTELRGLAVSTDTIYAASFNENLIVRLSLDEQTLPSWGVVDSTANELINPVGMTFDSADNLYVTDYVSDGRTCRLHRIKDSVIQTSWAANDLYPALGPDWCPTDISRDTSGRFYLANGKGHSILRMTVSGNSILTETLPISNDVFAVPKSIVVAPDGRIIITELNQNRARILREIAGELTTDVTITDTGDVAAGLIGGPVGVAISGTHLFLTDDKSRVLKFTLGATSAQFVSAFTSTTTGPIPVLLNHPESLEIGPNGHLYVADRTSSRVVELDYSGTTPTVIAIYGNDGSRPGEFRDVTDIAFDSRTRMFVGQPNNRASMIHILEPLTLTKPIPTIVEMSRNAGNLYQNDVLTVTGQGQVSDSSRTIAAYVWTFVSRYTLDVKVFTTTVPVLTIFASSLYTRLQQLQLQVVDSAGEISLPVIAEQHIYVWPSPEPPNQLTVTPTPTGTPGPRPAVCNDQEWLFMVYASADNKDDGEALLSQFLATRNNVESPTLAQLAHCVSFAMQVDGPPTLSPGALNYGLFTDTVRWHGYPGQPLTQTSIGEVAMNDPASLKGFVVWAQKTYPARHYYLVIADHGQGILGTAWDHSSNPADPETQYMRVRDMAHVLSDPDVVPINVLHLDSCSMGLLEVAYDLRDSAQYLIASQYLGWSFFAYDQYMRDGAQTDQPVTLVSTIVNDYAGLARAGEVPFTISSTALKNIDAFRRDVDTLAVNLRAWVGLDPTRLGVLVGLRDGIGTEQPDWFLNSNKDLVNTPADVYVDLLKWSIRIHDRFTDTLTEGHIRSAAERVIANLQPDGNFIVTQAMGSNNLPLLVCKRIGSSNCNVPLNNLGGLSIYYPPKAVVPAAASSNSRQVSRSNAPVGAPNTGSVYVDYTAGANLDFATASRWDEFLSTALGASTTQTDTIDLLWLSKPYNLHLPILLRS